MPPRAQSGISSPLAWLVLLSVLATACATTRADSSRREVLRQTLLTRHEADLRRDPEAVAEKLRRMAKGNFAFFRGSLGLYPAEPTRFAAPDLAIAIIGDPHPENIGTFATGNGELIVDFNDFDRAGYGPFVEDLRRLSLGLFIAGDAADVPKKQRARLVQSAVAGYVAEIQAIAHGEAAVALRADSAFGGGLAEILDPPTTGLAAPATPALDEGARKEIEAALVRARPTLFKPADFSPEFFAVKSALRAQGGIASFFLRRIRARLEGPGPGPDDDVLVELKETPASSAAVLVNLQRQLQERPDEDPLLGYTQLGEQTYRLRSIGGQRQSVSVERLAQEVKGPGWGKKDLRLFGYEAGRLLGRGHARARGADGKSVVAALAKLVGDGAALKTETVAVTTVSAARLEEDLDHLRALLTEKGPQLGWTPSAR